jgi:hypothetical protein
VSWEDNETRKDPNTIYLFLATLGKELRQRITKASLTRQDLLVLQGHAKLRYQTGMRRENDEALNPYRPELTWWTTKSVRSYHLLRVPQLFC